MTDAREAPARGPAKKRAAPKAATKSKPAPKLAAAPKPEPAPKVEAARAPEASRADAHLIEFLSATQRAQMEQLSMNLARAAMTAQGAIAEAALRQADRPAALSPDPFHIAPALNEVMGRLAAQPDRMMRAQADLFARYLDLWKSAAGRVHGEAVQEVAPPARGDKRFNDPSWTENPVFDVIKQSYLITSDWLNDLVSGVEGVDPMTKRRVEFFTKMLTDAISPANFLLSNPAALREAMATNGESLLKGMENFAADLQRGGGQLSISQTDFTQFKVGENFAAAPGKVVFRNELIEILQF